jgi:putative two-component system response regulator
MKKINECSVLIVDDTEANIDILVGALGDEYELAVAMDGASALEAVAHELPDLILLDIMMPGMDGYEVCKRLKADAKTVNIPIIFLTAMTDIDSKTRAFAIGAVDYVTKPFEIAEVKARVLTHLTLKLTRQELAMQNEILEEKVIERTLEISLTQETTIDAMACLAEFRDPDTGGHIKRTKNYVKRLAEELKNYPEYHDQVTDTWIDQLYRSAPLHDIGKVGVPDDVLFKPGKLSNEEYAVMKKHTVKGYESLHIASHRLGQSSFLKTALELTRSHQERWDGSGYPDGLAGEQIPLSARIMAIADVYDALISKRVYKPSYTHEQAVSIIGESGGSHFDPRLVEIFLAIHEDFRDIAIRYSDLANDLAPEPAEQGLP